MASYVSTNSNYFESLPGPSHVEYLSGPNESANPPIPEVHDEEFEFEHTSCYICNGYYGPCFEEPVCATCHAFLFPEAVSGSAQEIPVFSEKTDDGDSGNDEPTDDGPERRSSAGQGVVQPPPPAPSTPPPRPDPLAHQLDLLTTPREPDNCSSYIIKRLPVEVLLAVFSYLDDISLWRVSNVCKRWRQVLHSMVSQEMWHTYTLRRWPLYKPIYAVNDWFTVYAQLMNSCSCRTCLMQMSDQLQPIGKENSFRRRLRLEIKNLKVDPPEGVEAMPLDPKSCHWMATITGPVGSPYEGGVFFLYLQVPYSYPLEPPTVRFITRIFHPNVSRHGDVGIDCIRHNWALALTISKVLISVQSLLTDPFCQVCMEPAVGRMYLNDRDRFEAIARVWTWRYAMHDLLPLHPLPPVTVEETSNSRQGQSCSLYHQNIQEV